TMKWGLIPSWSKDMSFASKMINARCETITVKPIWRQLIPQQRGIAVASGYFEWKKSAAGKIPHYIHREDGKLLLMAALWDVWKSPDKKVILSYSVITCSASHRLKHIHERMPVFIGQHQISVWLESVHYSQSKALALLVPNDEGLINHPVSTLVNNVKNNSPECIKPAQQ
ncbi:MAG: SOS response-associated peptidase, partial [Fidelibacterota bacterium]